MQPMPKTPNTAAKAMIKIKEPLALSVVAERTTGFKTPDTSPKSTLKF